MGNKLSICRRDSSSGLSPCQEQQESIQLTGLVKKSIEPSLMPGWWTERDVIYQKVSAVREKLEEMDLGNILCIITKFVPCQINSCKCKGWRYNGIMQDSYGWKNNVCTKSGCKHPQSDHMSHLVNATMNEFSTLLRLVFDTINIKGTLENESKKSKALRNVVLEEVFYSIYRELRYCLRLGSFVSFDVNKIYGTPPFEKTSINQILMNFCMYRLSGNNSTEFKNCLIITKFILKYFDTWVWITPKELLNFNSHQYSKSYHYYYQRYMVFCCLPRLVHSISDRYKTSMIFGQEVLKYTLKVFRMQLQDWCTKGSVTWLNHTKLFCLDRLPKYLDLLEAEVYTNRSPIWNIHYNLSDFKNKIGDFEFNKNNEVSLKNVKQ